MIKFIMEKADSHRYVEIKKLAIFIAAVHTPLTKHRKNSYSSSECVLGSAGDCVT